MDWREDRYLDLDELKESGKISDEELKEYNDLKFQLGKTAEQIFSKLSEDML